MSAEATQAGLASPLQPLTFEGGGSEALLLRDLSLARRAGVRGPGAREWLTSQGLPGDIAPNRISEESDQGLVMALSQRELWLLQPDAVASSQQPDSAALVPGAWPLYCQHSHAWLMLSGEPKAAMMAKLCGVDLRDGAFPLGQVAQTQMAHVSVVIAHHRYQDEAVFSLFVDQSLAEYAASALTDAMAEFNQPGN